MSMGHATGHGPARWWLMLFCALFSVLFVHGVEGAFTHLPRDAAHGTAAAHEDHPYLFHQVHHAIGAETAGEVEEPATEAMVSEKPQPHQHTDYPSMAPIFALFLLLVCPPASLGPVAVPRDRGSVLPSWIGRGSGPRRPRHRLIAELSVLRI